MKISFLPLGLLVAVVSGLGVASAQAFGPYYNPYDGTATVTAGKKAGSLVAAATASTTDGTDSHVLISGKGPKGIQVSVDLTLNANGQGTLTLNAKVQADPRKVLKNESLPAGKKVNVRIKAKGTYTVVDPTTVNFVFSGNSGKNGGTNVTGTFTTDALGNMSFTANSGFKQKVSGLGRGLAFSFTGVSSTIP
jgi:hypothetical protein